MLSVLKDRPSWFFGGTWRTSDGRNRVAFEGFLVPRCCKGSMKFNVLFLLFSTVGM